MTRWARRAVPGCDLQIAWGQTSADPVAQIVTLRPEPSFAAYRPKRAFADGERVCQLLTDVQRPIASLVARGAHFEDVEDVLALLWFLDRKHQSPIGSARTRVREAATVEQTAAILMKYKDLLYKKTPWASAPSWPGGRRSTYLYTFASEMLPWVARTLRDDLQAPTGKRAKRGILIVVRVLDELLRRRGVIAPAREIAAVIQAAWPSQYKPGAFDEAATARKLLTRARRAIDDEIVVDVLGNLPSSVRASLARLPPKDRIPVVGGGFIGIIRDVPANVPATPRTQSKTTPPHSRVKRKTR